MTRYFIAGGTSELGNRVVKGLTDYINPEQITCLVRATSNSDFLRKLNVKIVTGDVAVPDTIKSYMESTVTYIDMTHPKYYQKSIETVKLGGIKRAFFVTTTGIFSRYNHCSDIYKIGESRIKSSGIEYTILRPSLIYGTDRDRNMTKLLKILSRSPVFPIFGAGDGLMQPVYVQDLADGILKAILDPELTRDKEYNLCGPEAIPYKKVLSLACQALGRNVKFVHIPHSFAANLVNVLQHLPGFPITDEQVLRLSEDKKFDISAAVKDLNYSPRSFAQGIVDEVCLLKKKGILKLGKR